MTTKREFNYDKDTKLLTVRAISEDKFSLEQVKNIISDLKAKQKQALEMILKFTIMERALKKIVAEPRTKDIAETILAFIQNAEIPSQENIDKTLKYWRDNLDKLNEDLKALEPFMEVK